MRREERRCRMPNWGETLERRRGEPLGEGEGMATCNSVWNGEKLMWRPCGELLLFDCGLGVEGDSRCGREATSGVILEDGGIPLGDVDC